VSETDSEGSRDDWIGRFSTGRNRTTAPKRAAAETPSALRFGLSGTMSDSFELLRIKDSETLTNNSRPSTSRDMAHSERTHSGGSPGPHGEKPYDDAKHLEEGSQSQQSGSRSQQQEQHEPQSQDGSKGLSSQGTAAAAKPPEHPRKDMPVWKWRGTIAVVYLTSVISGKLQDSSQDDCTRFSGSFCRLFEVWAGEMWVMVAYSSRRTRSGLGGAVSELSLSDMCTDLFRFQRVRCQQRRQHPASTSSYRGSACPTHWRSLRSCPCRARLSCVSTSDGFSFSTSSSSWLALPSPVQLPTSRPSSSVGSLWVLGAAMFRQRMSHSLVPDA
jgi:hypothetical protein